MFNETATSAGLLAPPEAATAPATVEVRENVLPRWRCRVAYDGTDFAGWQSQPDGRAIQDVIERRLATLLGREVRIHASGRTDAGVHAQGQVFHFDAEWAHGAEKLLAAIRVGLPPSIQVQTARKVPSTFHARFSATGKIYHYHVFHGGYADPFTHRYRWSIARTLNVDAMRAAAAVLVGTHDFAPFSAFNGDEKESTVRTLRRLEVVERGAVLRIEAEADGFLYKMVRSLAGALVYAGGGKLTPADLTTILNGGLRTHKVETAPPQGLFLMRVFYGAATSDGAKDAGPG